MEGSVVRWGMRDHVWCLFFCGKKKSLKKRTWGRGRGRDRMLYAQGDP